MKATPGPSDNSVEEIKFMGQYVHDRHAGISPRHYLDFGSRLEGSVGLQIQVTFQPIPGLRLGMDASSSPSRVPGYSSGFLLLLLPE